MQFASSTEDADETIHNMQRQVIMFWVTDRGGGQGVRCAACQDRREDCTLWDTRVEVQLVAEVLLKALTGGDANNLGPAPCGGR